MPRKHPKVGRKLILYYTNRRKMCLKEWCSELV